MKKWLHLIILLPITIVGQSYQTFDNGTASYNWHPFYGLYDYSHNMYIYNQNDLGSNGKEMFELSFELFGYGQNYAFNGITIKLAHTTDSIFKSDATVNLSNINYTDLTTCVELYNLTISSNGWIRIPFTSTFNYNGVDNLLVIIENHDGEWDSGFGSAYCDYKNQYVSWYTYSDNSYPTGTGTRDKFIPNIQFGYFDFSPLPITLYSFDAQIIQGGLKPSVQLNWSTASERNNHYFTIWRSIDGLDWNAIENIPGAANSTELLNYEFLDHNIPKSAFHEGIIYYKLSQSDYDGTTEFFDIIGVELPIQKNHQKRIINILGQDIKENDKGLIFEIDSFGRVHKKYKN